MIWTNAYLPNRIHPCKHPQTKSTWINSLTNCKLTRMSLLANTDLGRVGVRFSLVVKLLLGKCRLLMPILQASRKVTWVCRENTKKQTCGPPKCLDGTGLYFVVLIQRVPHHVSKTFDTRSCHNPLKLTQRLSFNCGIQDYMIQF